MNCLDHKVYFHKKTFHIIHLIDFSTDILENTNCLPQRFPVLKNFYTIRKTTWLDMLKQYISIILNPLLWSRFFQIFINQYFSTHPKSFDLFIQWKWIEWVFVLIPRIYDSLKASKYMVQIEWEYLKNVRKICIIPFWLIICSGKSLLLTWHWFLLKLNLQ